MAAMLMVAAVLGGESLSVTAPVDPGAACSNASFPHDLTGLQVMGLSAQHHANSAAECIAACVSRHFHHVSDPRARVRPPCLRRLIVSSFRRCCAAGDGCEVWEWAGTGNMGGCWIGRYDKPSPAPRSGFLGGARANTPPPPPRPPPPPPPRPPGAPYTIDSTNGLGLRWEGVGAISGGGPSFTKVVLCSLRRVANCCTLSQAQHPSC